MQKKCLYVNWYTIFLLSWNKNIVFLLCLKLQGKLLKWKSYFLLCAGECYGTEHYGTAASSLFFGPASQGSWGKNQKLSCFLGYLGCIIALHLNPLNPLQYFVFILFSSCSCHVKSLCASLCGLATSLLVSVGRFRLSLLVHILRATFLKAKLLVHLMILL